MVAFDFDMTIVSIHTGGRYDGTAFELVQYVRPEFQCFMQQLLINNITMVITTFSTQKDLILNVLQQILICPDILGSPTAVQCTSDCNGVVNFLEMGKSPDCSLSHVNIPVYGGQDMMQNYEEGKQSQLIHAIQFFHSLGGRNGNNDNMKDKNHMKLESSKNQSLDLVHVVLIDDDYDNIRIAKKDGYRTIHYDPTNDNINSLLFNLPKKVDRVSKMI